MADTLTVKQEAFALSYVETGNASEAYRQSYNVGESTKPESVWQAASHILADIKVASRVMELQQAAQERTLVTVESITAELDQARDLASAEKQAAAMTGAIMGKAKVNGLLVDRVGDPNGKPITMPTEIILRAVTSKTDDSSTD